MNGPFIIWDTLSWIVDRLGGTPSRIEHEIDHKAGPSEEKLDSKPESPPPIAELQTLSIIAPPTSTPPVTHVGSP